MQSKIIDQCRKYHFENENQRLKRLRLKVELLKRNRVGDERTGMSGS